LTSRRPHGNADVRSRQSSSVIHAITDKRNPASLRHALHEADLIFWQEISFDVFARQSKLLADPQGDRPSVARHHGNPDDTRLAKMIERLPRGRTHSVGH